MTATAGRPADVEVGRRPAAFGGWSGPVTTYYLLIGATGLLLSIGLVMVLSSSTVDSLVASKGTTPYAVFLNQAKFALIGLPLAWIASRLPVRFYRRVAWPVLLGVMGLQALVPFIGKEVNGNKNWLIVGGQQIQPSELLKLALALWLGNVLATKRALLHRWLHVLVPGVVVAMGGIGLVLVGDDLGTAMVMILLVAGALFVAGVPLWMFGLAGAGAAIAVYELAHTTNRLARIEAFLSPHCDIQKECYQTQRGLYALASGGWTGVGLGQSRQKWAGLPEAHNDFIYAIIGEELGLLGAGVVLLLVGVLAVAMTRLIRRHEDMFVRVATGAIATWIVGQALINIGVVIGVLPVIGLPLPLVSAGGSALITTLVAIGVLIAFARSEPGATEALTARAGAVRRSLAVIGRTGDTAGEGLRGRRRTRG
jgi:cell division protein FtsW